MRLNHFLLAGLTLLLFSCTQTYIVTFSGSEGGSVSEIGGEFDEGTTVSVTATPTTGYEFQGWSDGSMQNPRTITVSESLNLTALFTKKQISINVSIQGGGTVLDESGNSPSKYEFGSTVKLTPKSNEGYYFIGWEVSFNISEVSSSPGLAAYTSSLQSQISAIQAFNSARVSAVEQGVDLFIDSMIDNGGEFDEIINGVDALYADSIQVLLSLPVFTNLSITAKFAKRHYVLNISSSNSGGSVSVNNSSFNQRYLFQPYGTSIVLKGQPAQGWEFTGWTGDIESENNPLTLTLEKNLSVNAEFIRKKFDLNVSIEGEGSVSEEVVVQSGQYDFETRVKLTAVPEENWEFINWSGDLTSTENPVIIEVNNTKSITAKFAKKDSDKDGVPDDIDQCSDTPEGSLVDELGCPTDLNNNGIPDDLEGDADNDGVIDYYDECSNTTPGASVDSKGCAVVDQVFLFSGAVSTVVLNNNVSGTISFSIRNNLDEPIQLESLNVYDGDTGVLRATANKNANPNLFPSLSPGQSHSLQSTFNSFIYLPMYHWRFTYKGQVYEVSKRWNYISGQSKPSNNLNNSKIEAWDKKVVSFKLLDK